MIIKQGEGDQFSYFINYIHVSFRRYNSDKNMVGKYIQVKLSIAQRHKTYTFDPDVKSLKPHHISGCGDGMNLAS